MQQSYPDDDDDATVIVSARRVPNAKVYDTPSATPACRVDSRGNCFEKSINLSFAKQNRNVVGVKRYTCSALFPCLWCEEENQFLPVDGLKSLNHVCSTFFSPL